MTIKRCGIAEYILTVSLNGGELMNTDLTFLVKKSNKTKNGALESGAGWKGLCRKGMSLVIVLIAVRLDITIGTNYIRDTVCIAFIANETISIVENAGLMGVPIPTVITKAIEVLKNKTEESEGK